LKTRPDKTDEQQGKLRKEHSGNPFGRRREIKNKATIEVEALLTMD